MRRVLGIAGLLGVGVAVLAAVPAFGAVPNTERVSVSSSGHQANGGADGLGDDRPSISVHVDTWRFRQLRGTWSAAIRTAFAMSSCAIERPAPRNESASRAAGRRETA